MWLIGLTGPTYEAVVHVKEAWSGDLSSEIVLDLGNGLCCNCSLGGEGFEIGDEFMHR